MTRRTVAHRVLLDPHRMEPSGDGAYMEQRDRHRAALDDAIRPTPAQSARIALMRHTARPIVSTPTALPSWSWGSIAITAVIGLVVWVWVLSMIGRAMTEAAAAALDAAKAGGGF